MKLNFLTWNIKSDKKSKLFFEDINAQVKKSKIDVLVLQECVYDENVCELKNFIEIEGFIKGSGIKRWVRIFINKNSKIDYNFPTSYLNNKIKCVEIKTRNGFAFNLIGVHLYSKGGGKSEGQQLFQNEELPKLIEEYEIGKTTKSIIVGDLNYTPFDKALAHPNFLNTTNDKSIIEKFKTRSIKDKEVRFFYNPMWNLLGDYGYDKKRKNAGSYWYADDVEKFHWNLLDGVLLSPPIMRNINIKSIKILSEINGKNLIKTKIEKQTESLLAEGFSDHLPVSFTFNAS